MTRSNSAIYYPAWADCHDPMGTMDSLRDRVACCFDIVPASQHATLVVAARTPAGQVRLELRHDAAVRAPRAGRSRPGHRIVVAAP